MKKSFLALSVLLSIGMLSACSNSKDNASNESSASSSISQQKEPETSSSKKETQTNSEFKGKIAEKPVIEDETVTVTINKVEAIKDSEGINASFSPDGVVLIADKKVFDESVKVEDLAEGDELDFILSSTPAMTKSIPPQISGDSVIKISLAK
ncbi:hypothetical protein [Vagococcus carniphilus]|uniref:Lipoprotein n=1 Tax=Vagococcus carniphilus TaxID=218144 RepID=A0A430B7X1_9ENTE|nr:hypothetical protein [Vagococcus carniphilus]QNN74349.1 hypothetical protein H9L18_07140 [Vagococcus carniphilus]RSU16347.1 hypothetical protein CBF28_02130 [Vagococcus carniphilus]